MKRSNKVPQLKENIILIVEGKSDEKFIERLKILFNSKYNIEVVNAKSGTRILKKYKDKKKVFPEKEILVLYDLDNCKTLTNIKNEYKQEGIKLEDNQLYYINPEIELLFILWYEKRAYTMVSDDEYKKIIFDIYGIKNYRKTESELKKIMSEITSERVSLIIKNIKSLKLNKNSNKLPSTNFDKLFEKLFK